MQARREKGIKSRASLLRNHISGSGSRTMSAANANANPPQPRKKTAQIKDTIMIKKEKKKFSLMKTLFSNAFVCTKPNMQEQSISVSVHHRNAIAATTTAAAAEKELVVNKKEEKEDSIYNITHDMNPYYISHKFPFYNNTQFVVPSKDSEDDDSDKPIYDDEERPRPRPPMEIVSSVVVQRKATEKIVKVEEEEEEEEFVNPFGKEKSSLNSCFFYNNVRLYNSKDPLQT